MTATAAPHTEVYEVHYWPHTGRVLSIYLPAGGGPARLTDVRVVNTGGHGTTQLAETTALLAEVIADAGNPQGGLVEHTAGGTVHTIWEQL